MYLCGTIRPRVSVETTIPSAYFEVRTAASIVLTSYQKCDFLVTWNCQHLANANKFGHIRRITTLLGLYVPALVTPLELLGENGANS